MNDNQKQFANEYFKSREWDGQWIMFDSKEIQLDGWFTSEQLFGLAEAMKKIEEMNE